MYLQFLDVYNSRWFGRDWNIESINQENKDGSSQTYSSHNLQFKIRFEGELNTSLAR